MKHISFYFILLILLNVNFNHTPILNLITNQINGIIGLINKEKKLIGDFAKVIGKNIQDLIERPIEIVQRTFDYSLDEQLRAVSQLRLLLIAIK